jgi:CRP-like cAMP-binding protein
MGTGWRARHTQHVPGTTFEVAQRNQLLASLSPRTLAEVVARAEYVRLAEHAPIYDPGEPIPHVNFPLCGLLSVVATSRDGGMIEVGPIGCEGMLGLPVFLGGGTDRLQAFVQVAPVDAVRLDTPVFLELIQDCPDFQRMMRRYAQWSYCRMAQCVLCARRHPVAKRIARWLLMCHDRLAQDQFPLTHEYLAQMLGVQRASVTIAAGALRKGGLIKYHRGMIGIPDRPRLERAACECNRVTAEEYRWLIGREPRATRQPAEPQAV